MDFMLKMTGIKRFLLNIIDNIQYWQDTKQIKAFQIGLAKKKRQYLHIDLVQYQGYMLLIRSRKKSTLEHNEILSCSSKMVVL
jgi:hypothetical protein